MQSVGVTLLIIGRVIALVGVILIFAPATPPGHLPGDLHIEGEHARFYFPS